MNLHKDDTKAFLEYLGYEVDSHYKFRMRDENTASASIDPKNGYIKDFGSGFRGDVIAFYKEIKGCDDRTAFIETKKILDSLKINNKIHQNHSNSSPAFIKVDCSKQPEPSIEPLKEQILEQYANERKENFARFTELMKGLMPTADNNKRREIAQTYNIGYSKQEDRLIMPLRDENSNIITLWKYNPKLNIKYSFSKNRPRCGFNLYMIKEYVKNPNEPIWIAEGEKDCINMLARGYRAISFGSAGTHLRQSHINMLKNCYLIIAYDYDDAGKNGANTLKEQLKNSAKYVEIIDWEQILTKKGLQENLKKGFDFTDFIELIDKKQQTKEI